MKDVPPVYPPVAQSARLQGVVIIQARVEADGHVSNAQVTQGIPLLNGAAVDAVRQWEFTPTLVNGKPVPLLVTATWSSPSTFEARAPPEITAQRSGPFQFARTLWRTLLSGALGPHSRRSQPPR